MQAEVIKQLIERGLENAQADVQGNDGVHFKVEVICPLFSDQSRLQRERLVLETVKAPLLAGTLHALSITPLTEEEWQQRTGK